MNRAASRRRLITASAVLTLLAGATTAAAYTAPPPGAPARPAPGAGPDPSLTDHKLAYAPGPLDNPDKGLAVYYQAGQNQNTGYPHSLTWSYFGLSEVMTDPDDCGHLDWTVVDKVLNETASYGNRAAIRFCLEYPGDPGGGHPGNAIPACFAGKVPTRTDAVWNTQSPDYDNPFLLDSLPKFIAAYGARYDGDPCLAYVQLGLVGLWGEWHNVGVTIADDGVAPFYQPWGVRLGLRDASGTVVKTWDTDWDLRTVMPSQIRAFPDWKTGSTYLPYGYPQNFQTRVDTAGLPHGDYQLVMSVVNPLSAVSANAKPLRFADATQGADGWLTLGSLTAK
jgi:hypothetical protein